MKAIGGYYSLELPKHKEYHTNAIKLNTGRNCLEYILRVRHYKKVYIPYYTCSVLLEPFKKLGINYAFYNIDNNLEIDNDITTRDEEALLYVNYFGIKDKYITFLSKQFGQRLIIDNTQAFFSPPHPGIDTFYTCRKFFGVPDGAYLYTEAQSDFNIERDFSHDRMSFLLKRIDLSAEEGFSDFRKESDSLIGQPIKKMSHLTERIMQSIDYNSVAFIRRANYLYLHNQLSKSNAFKFDLDDNAVPLVYPYLNNLEYLRSHLIQNRIFVAQYWPNVLKWSPLASLECKIAKYLLPLPIDQRYDLDDMKKIVISIQK